MFFFGRGQNVVVLHNRNVRRVLYALSLTLVVSSAHASNKIKFSDGSSGILTALNAVNSDSSVSGIVKFIDSYGNTKTGSVVLKRSTAGLALMARQTLAKRLTAGLSIALALSPVILTALQNAGITPQKDANGNIVTDTSGLPVLVKTSSGTATYTQCTANQTLPLCSDSTKTASARGGLDCYQLNQVNGRTEIFYTQQNPNFDTTWLNQFGSGSTISVSGAAFVAGATCALSTYYKTTRPQSVGSLTAPEFPSSTSTATDSEISTALSTKPVLEQILSPLAQTATIPDDFFDPVVKTSDLTNETSTGDSTLNEDATTTDDATDFDSIDKISVDTFDLRSYFDFSGNWLPRTCFQSPSFTVAVGSSSKQFQFDTSKICYVASTLIAPSSDVAAIVIFLVIVFRSRGAGS